ncbi:unnamed protein product, partial [Amoebophrya sp. A25]
KLLPINIVERAVVKAESPELPVMTANREMISQQASKPESEVALPSSGGKDSSSSPTRIKDAAVENAAGADLVKQEDGENTIKNAVPVEASAEAASSSGSTSATPSHGILVNPRAETLFVQLLSSTYFQARRSNDRTSSQLETSGEGGVFLSLPKIMHCFQCLSSAKQAAVLRMAFSVCGLRPMTIDLLEIGGGTALTKTTTGSGHQMIGDQQCTRVEEIAQHENPISLALVQHSRESERRRDASCGSDVLSRLSSCATSSTCSSSSLPESWSHRTRLVVQLQQIAWRSVGALLCRRNNPLLEVHVQRRGAQHS